MPTTLSDLVEYYDANAIIMADAGNGCGYGSDGHMVEYCGECAEEFGDVEMAELAAPHISDDGHKCLFAFEWIIQGEGDNPYRIRIYF